LINSCKCRIYCVARKTWETALFVACQHGYMDAVHMLVNHHADVNTARKDGTTPLHIAACKGHMPIVKYLVEECHAAIHTTTTNGSTPINHASKTEIAEYLKIQMMKVFIRTNALPFSKDVLKIIIQYLQSNA